MGKKINQIHSNPEHMESMIIGSGHTIMAGFLPKGVEPRTFSENFYKWNHISQESVEKLGLFGGDIDYNTYYPGLTKEDLTPNSEEFIEPVFRLLSSTIVSKNWNPTDFGQPGVLKASMKLLLGQTVNCDHLTDIGNAIGSVSQVMWQEAYKDGNFVIPAGINGVLKIDGKANPRIARGILMDPPSIHSNSVTVQFKWDKSHPGMDDRDFWNKLGTYDEKGNMIRKVVTEVVRYLETSLVSHGADAFAQKVGEDGKIINPEFAKRTWTSFAEYQEDTKKAYYFTDFKDDFKSFQESNDTPENNINPLNTNKKESTMTLAEFLESLYGDNMLSLAEGQEKTAEVALQMVKDLVHGKNDLQAKVDNLTTEKNTLAEQVSNKEAEIANLTAMATVGKNHIASLRETTVANYKKLKGDAADETIITMLNAETTGLQTLVSLNKDYQAQLDEKFPLTCSHCGSHDVSRGSSVQEPKEDPNTTQNSEVNSTDDVIENLYNKKMYNK